MIRMTEAVVEAAAAVILTVVEDTGAEAAVADFEEEVVAGRLHFSFYLSHTHFTSERSPH